MITNFTFASAKIDERLVAPDMLDNIKGLLGADMGYISPDLSDIALSDGLICKHRLEKICPINDQSVCLIVLKMLVAILRR